MSVSFATFCYGPHLSRLHEPGVLEQIVRSHEYNFDEILVVHQRCRGMSYRPITEVPHRVIESEDYYPQIFDRFNIDLNNPVSAKDCHGPDWHWWWPNHVQNHLITLEEAKSDYIVFSDCDCLIKDCDPSHSWVTEAISILEKYPHVLIVGDGRGQDTGGETYPERQPATLHRKQRKVHVHRL